MIEQKSPVAKIWEAISVGDVDLTRSLFFQHPEMVNAFIPFGGGTFLHLAASKQGVDMAEALLKIGFDVNKGGKFAGDTALVSACSYGNYSVAKYLIDNEAKLDVESPQKNPLFGAIIGCSSEIVRLLLEAGIDTSVRYTGESMKNMDAIAFALERGERLIAREIALWNSNGDVAKANAILEIGQEIAKSNNT
ncbi:ankyrin repeat domain-containing protein [Aquidulcibacter sp.]|jgi:ankyrin repeat protein|uniref:ankyrin repeat domain-containing protein n=1 Tax=Aquidulcibacter sp. TaxID=2052990 RepID=UPI0037C0D08B